MTVILCLMLTFNVSSEESIVVPQMLLDQVAEGNAEAAYYIALQFDKNSFADDEMRIDTKAQEWMKKAAEMEYPQAMLEWAMMLEYEEKETEALQWLLKAADVNVADAIAKIAYYYINGLAGLPKDCKIAYQWYEKAQIYDHKIAYNDHAWSLATSPYDVCRSPEKALFKISKLMTIYQDEFEYVPPAVLDTKAAVHASISDFNKAIEIQKQALEIIGDSHAKFESYQNRLEMYQNRKVWVQSK
ncbi:MAG: tetratricopeptide repeat protein [Marinicellaceae bacterium]